MPCSGFLIDNCDDEELPPVSPPPCPPPPPPPDDATATSDENLSEQRALLVSELDAAEAERRQALKQQKRLHQKLQKKKKQKPTEESFTTKTETPSTSSSPDPDEQEFLSDWIIEYDTGGSADPVAQLTNEVRRTSVSMSDEDKAAKVNMILLKIKKQQQELNRLRQYVMSMLGEPEKSKASKMRRSSSVIPHDLLLAFLNQPAKSGCWLCSGKMYAEIGTQCEHADEQ